MGKPDLSTQYSIMVSADENVGTGADISNAGNAVTLRRSIGVEVIWVRKSARRRGLATVLVDAARESTAKFGEKPLPRNAVAFSQPTDMGSAFARGYSLGPAFDGQ